MSKEIISKENKTKKKKSGNILAVVLFIMIGGACGFFGGSVLAKEGGNLKTDLITVVLVLIFVYTAIFIQMIVHEGGHLVFGKISGYQFSSFRIGRLMLMKDKGKYKFKKYTIVGTGGQCLMMPPTYDEYEYPYILYNLGGIIVNIILGLMCLLLYVFVPLNRYFSLFFLLMFMIGIAFALINGIPMRLGGIANDGHNALSLGKDRDARHAFWLILRTNGLISCGGRLCDMPQTWFEFQKDWDLSNPITCSLGGLRFGYLFDLKQFDEAKALNEYLLENATGMLEIHKNELRCELMFLEIIGLYREDEIDELYTKDLQKYIKATASYVSRQRLMYAYELLVKKDFEKAQKHLKEFEKTAKSYPFQGEIDSERELIDLITDKSK